MSTLWPAFGREARRRERSIVIGGELWRTLRYNGGGVNG
jgi:hypothetical protein